MALQQSAQQTITGCGLKISVDESRCIGIGSCETLAARHFRLNADRIAEFVNADQVDEDLIMEAAMECPVDAIRVEAEDGRELWPLY